MPSVTSCYLSARTSKGLVPRDQLRTIQAESIAARKPRAIPVPMGQKGCEEDRKQRIKMNYLLREKETNLRNKETAFCSQYCFGEVRKATGLPLHLANRGSWWPVT